MASNNPWKDQPRVGGAPATAGSIKNKFEEMGKPAPKPQIIKGKTTWSATGNSGDVSNQGKFARQHQKPKKSDFGPAPSLADLP
ncbi:PEST proteolytic signal-containing nuclear protein [Balamuthia mandrillaris]